MDAGTAAPILAVAARIGQRWRMTDVPPPKPAASVHAPVTAAYDADVAEIAALPGVEFIMP